MTSRSYPVALEQFTLRNVEGLTSGRERGAGAYGIVREVTVTLGNGVKIPCIAKKLHGILGDENVSERERVAIRKRFQEECVILSKLKHPNIVHFLGVHFGRTSDDLSLIMEQLDTDLYTFIRTAQNPIPLSIQLSVLLDVAYGLLYLHTGFSPSIIHRDLSARNVLLSRKCEFRAKLADLGVAKLMDRAEMSRAPGTQQYMPPEALCSDNPMYGVALDVFSFGHLSLCIAAQKVQGIVQDIDQLQDLESIRSFKWKGKLQLLKRRKALNMIEGIKHPLLALMSHCLKDNPKERPTTGKLVDELQDIRIRHPITIPDHLSVTLEGQTYQRTTDEDKAGLLLLTKDQKAHINILADETQKLKLEKRNLQKVTEQLKLKSSPGAMKQQREGVFEKKAAEFELVIDRLRHENRDLYSENSRLTRMVVQRTPKSHDSLDSQQTEEHPPRLVLPTNPPAQTRSHHINKHKPAGVEMAVSECQPVPVPRKRTSLSWNFKKDRDSQYRERALAHLFSEPCPEKSAVDQDITAERPSYVLSQDSATKQALQGSRDFPAVCGPAIDTQEYYNLSDLTIGPRAQANQTQLVCRSQPQLPAPDSSKGYERKLRKKPFPSTKPSARVNPEILEIASTRGASATADDEQVLYLNVNQLGRDDIVSGGLGNAGLEQDSDDYMYG